MVIGIGIDLFEVARVEYQLLEPGSDFGKALFTDAEIAYCQSKHRPAVHYAGRFAAKEAVIKALALGGGSGSFWHDVEIVNAEGGRPVVVLSGKLREVADRLGASRIHVTITHTDKLALAAAVVES